MVRTKLHIISIVSNLQAHTFTRRHCTGGGGGTHCVYLMSCNRASVVQLDYYVGSVDEEKTERKLYSNNVVVTVVAKNPRTIVLANHRIHKNYDKRILPLL